MQGHGDDNGVAGYASLTGNPGVYGANTGVGVGVVGDGGSGDSKGVWGKGNTGVYGQGIARGVVGLAQTAGIGVSGSAPTGTGVRGDTQTGTGVIGAAGTSSVIAGTGVLGLSTSPFAVPIVAKGGLYQHSHLQQWRDYAGTILSWVDRYGAFYSPGFSVVSDIRLKESIEPLTSVLDRLELLTPVSFQWKQPYASPGRLTGSRQIGLIAQEVQSVFPDLVSTGTGNGVEDCQTVDYGRFSAVLIQAVKELHGLLKVLNLENKVLREKSRKIDELRVRVETLEHSTRTLPKQSR